MKTLYIECHMGAAGDMIMASLLELHENPTDFITRLNSIGIPNVKVSVSPSIKCGIAGTHVTVTIHGMTEHTADTHTHNHSHIHSHEHNHEHSHNSNRHSRTLHDIEHLISHLNVSEQIKKDAFSVYSLIAEAESHAHNKPVGEVHFHEVGAMDAVADIVGVCMLMEEIAPAQILVSPIHVGSGQVHCAHGVLPVPAPATSYILKDVPIYGGRIQGELCTPTGAALLKHFATGFGDMPVMRVEKIGYGMGEKDFNAANCVRAFLGETDEQAEEVTELCCNIDDMTPESLSFAVQQLFDTGALDVYTIPVGMKKGRTGILLTCMCRSQEKETFAALLFKHTTTLGIRETVSRRYTLDRSEYTVNTCYGPVRVKASSGYGVSKQKPEYEDVAKIARENNLSISCVIQKITSESL